MKLVKLTAVALAANGSSRGPTSKGLRSIAGISFVPVFVAVSLLTYSAFRGI